MFWFKKKIKLPTHAAVGQINHIHYVTDYYQFTVRLDTDFYSATAFLDELGYERHSGGGDSVTQWFVSGKASNNQFTRQSEAEDAARKLASKLANTGVQLVGFDDETLKKR